MKKLLRSIRLQSNQSTSLDRSTGQAGEIFYDATNKTLRIYDGRLSSGSILATQTWVTNNTTQLPAQTNNSAKYLTTNGTALRWDTVTIPAQIQSDWNATSGLGQILNKPLIPSLSGYATESYVDTAVSGISIPSLSGYATESYVGDAIAAIPAPSFSNLEGLGFQRGAIVNEFSTDGDFTDNATDTVPTENATRTYIDKRLGLDHSGAPVPAFNLIGPGYAALNGATFSGNVVANNNVSSSLAVLGGTEYGLVQERVLPIFIQSTTPTQTLGAGASGWNNQFYCTLQTANFTPNINNVPTGSYSTTTTGAPTMITFTYIMVQGASTQGIPTGLKINDVTQTIRWAGNTVPSGTVNKIDVVTFKCYVVDGVTANDGLFTVLGSMTSFG